MATESDESESTDDVPDDETGSEAETSPLESADPSSSTSNAPAGEEDTGTESDDSEEAEGKDAGRFSPHVRGMIVTSIATLMGIVAGILSMLFATAAGSPPDPDNTIGFAILVGAVIVQFPFFKVIGMEVEAFGTKDQVYIFAMTFMLWFVTWSILLTTEALI